MLILFNGLNGMCFGWMRGLYQKIIKIVTISLLLMVFYPRYVVLMSCFLQLFNHLFLAHYALHS
jgi:hypothetical protein